MPGAGGETSLSQGPCESELWGGWFEACSLKDREDVGAGVCDHVKSSRLITVLTPALCDVTHCAEDS